MNENGKKRSIQAGKAFMAAIADNPDAKQQVASAARQLQAFAEGVKAARVTNGEAMEAISRFFASCNDALKNVAKKQEQLIQVDLARLQKEQAFAELGGEFKKLTDEMKADLAAYGFDPPESSEDWETLARITEKEPGPMTLGEIYVWAIAWAKREIVRCKIARCQTPSHAGDKQPTPQETRTAEDASIRRDEHDPRVAWCVGKRIYLGDDTQVSRLFWLLASPPGRACSLADVQRAIDGFETDADKDEFNLAMQRVRKALSRLRQAIRENKADDHLLIVRGGGNANPEYTMLLRFGGRP